MSACLFLYISKSLFLFCSYLKIYTFKCAARFFCKHLPGLAVKSVNNIYVLQRVLGSVLSEVDFFFFPFFSRFSLIPSQSASLYIIASFEVYLIAENN